MLIQGVRLKENEPIRKNTLYYLPQSRVLKRLTLQHLWLMKQEKRQKAAYMR